MHQEVALANHLKEIWRAIGGVRCRCDSRWCDRLPCGSPQFGVREAGDLCANGEVEHAVYFRKRISVEREARKEERAHLLGHACLHLQSNHLAESSLSQLLFNRREEVIGLPLLNLKICVARDPE